MGRTGERSGSGVGVGIGMGVVAAALAWPVVAAAGPVGDTARGVNDAADRGGGGGGGGDRGDGPDRGDTDRGDHHDDGRDRREEPCATDASGSPWERRAWVERRAPRNLGPITVSFDGYVGLQHVVDSDGSLSAAARLELEQGSYTIGFGARATTFWERWSGPKPGDGGSVRLDLWGIGLHVLLLDGIDTRIWVDLGLAGVNTEPGVALSGGHGRLRLERRLGAHVRVSLDGRAYGFEDDVWALEGVAAAQVELVRVSYRVVDFDVGPPLHGPEVGLAVRF